MTRDLRVVAGRGPSGPLELWAGPECTVNRVGDRSFDQVERSGHAAREDDVDRLVDLGVTAVRQPIVWERVAPDGLDRADFAWVDRRLERLRARGVRVIAGLVHHGSGPRGTSLLDASFAEGLAAFAGAVAARFPWVEDWTPVNEPLTTARFSALYGHWYPHRRDTASFLRALLVETCATRAAMRAIREVIPSARLVQTEDLGRTYSTPRLAEQAAYENHRRWLSLDLLFGRVERGHPLRAHLLDHGIAEGELRSLERDPCPPDLVGVNYYVTSDRFLDEDVALYAPHCRGGNGRDVYADVEAVRARPEGIAGHEEVLVEAWERYGRPVALTEVHLGCTPEEQIRWLAEAWSGALRARARGADVCAATLWAAFGSFDWDSLVTRDAGHYEPGAFDVRGPTPRPTALARVARELARSGGTTHPLAAQPGWWRRDDRAFAHVRCVASPCGRPGGPVVLVTGAGGALGRAITAACAARHLSVRGLTRAELDVTEERAVDEAVASMRPWVVINAAGTGDPEVAERDPDLCRAHADGAAALARACGQVGARLVTFSSAFVFRGDKLDPYEEDDEVAPRSAWGRGHAAAERRVREALDRALIVRAGALFGPDEARSEVARTLATIAAGGTVDATDDRWLSPAYLPHVADATLDLAVDGAEGVVHVANAGVVSLLGWLRAACEAHGLTPASVRPCALPSGPAPRQDGLRSARWAGVPPLERALEAHASTRRRAALAGP
jgi:dTDP-4-dehydrorhamnose reductase